MSEEKKLVRTRFREAVFARDGHACRICKRHDGPLDAHHITNRHFMPNGGYVVENGITLCEDCHLKAEAANPYDLRYGSVSLYDLIGSSKGKAIEASNKILT
jgi:5-methylcytosine-specific restriction endonuclease McrA